jgi:hypothetical protein
MLKRDEPSSREFISFRVESYIKHSHLWHKFQSLKNLASALYFLSRKPDSRDHNCKT